MAGKHRQGFSLGGWLGDTFTGGLQDLPFPQHSDEYWMAEALRASMQEVGKPSPNPSVGCVFVKNNQIVAKGATLDYGGLHAERRAIMDCPNPEDLRGSDCYVTLEPCTHYGKQPPCVEVLVQVGIRRCIVAMQDPFSEINGRGIAYLRQHGIAVEVGVLGNECAAWHFPFLFSLAAKRPVIIGKWAQTLDGHLADDEGASKWISGVAARQHTHWLRQKYDAIAIGGATALMDQPSLDVRDCPGPINRHPLKLVYDPKGLLLQATTEQKKLLSSKLFQGQKVFWGMAEALCSKTKLDWCFKHEQFVLLSLPAEKSDFSQFIQQAAALYPKHNNGRKLQSIMVEGGPSLLSYLIHGGQLDAAHVFINSSFLGGSRHRIGSLANLRQELALLPSRAIGQKIQFQPLHLQSFGQDLLWDLITPDAYQQVWGRIHAP